MLKIDFLYRDEDHEVHFDRFSIRLKDGEFSSIEDCKGFWKYLGLSYLFENSDVVKVNHFFDRLTSLKDRSDINFDIKHKKISYDEILRNLKTGNGFTIFFNEDKSNVTFLELEDDDLRSNVIHKEIVKF
jgi:hypothetical protein